MIYMTFYLLVSFFILFCFKGFIFLLIFFFDSGLKKVLMLKFFDVLIFFNVKEDFFFVFVFVTFVVSMVRSVESFGYSFKSLIFCDHIQVSYKSSFFKCR